MFMFTFRKANWTFELAEHVDMLVTNPKLLQQDGNLDCRYAYSVCMPCFYREITDRL